MMPGHTQLCLGQQRIYHHQSHLDAIFASSIRCGARGQLDALHILPSGSKYQIRLMSTTLSASRHALTVQVWRWIGC
jgi:hypothetical protein